MAAKLSLSIGPPCAIVSDSIACAFSPSLSMIVVRVLLRSISLGAHLGGVMVTSFTTPRILTVMRWDGSDAYTRSASTLERPSASSTSVFTDNHFDSNSGWIGTLCFSPVNLLECSSASYRSVNPMWMSLPGGFQYVSSC